MICYGLTVVEFSKYKALKSFNQTPEECQQENVVLSQGGIGVENSLMGEKISSDILLNLTEDESLSEGTNQILSLVLMLVG